MEKFPVFVLENIVPLPFRTLYLIKIVVYVYVSNATVALPCVQLSDSEVIFYWRVQWISVCMSFYLALSLEHLFQHTHTHCSLALYELVRVYIDVLHLKNDRTAHS